MYDVKLILAMPSVKLAIELKICNIISKTSNFNTPHTK